MKLIQISAMKYKEKPKYCNETETKYNVSEFSKELHRMMHMKFNMIKT